MAGWEFWVVAVIGAMLTGLSKGGLSLLAGLTVPVMSLVMSPVAAAGLMLPVYVVSDWFGLFAYRKQFDRRVLIIGIVGLTLGIGLGWATASRVPENWVTAIVGFVALAFGLNQLLLRPLAARNRKAAVGPGLFWTTIAGFTSFVSHSGGPPWQVWTVPLGMPKTVFAGTITIAFTYANALKLIPYWYLGQINLTNLKAALVLLPVSVASVFAGVWIVKKLPEKMFYTLVNWSMLLIGIKLIWDGVTG